MRRTTYMVLDRPRHAKPSRPTFIDPGTLEYYPTEGNVLAADILRKFQQQLIEHGNDRAEDVRRTQEVFAISPDNGDDADRNTYTSKEEAALLIDIQDPTGEIPKINAMLARIENDLKGSKRNKDLIPFGKCLAKGCGNWIEAGRLDAVPYGPTCVAHTNGCARVRNLALSEIL